MQDDKPIITDDDEYWINGMTYCNPNDKSTFVTKRVGIGMTVNIVTSGGKVLCFGSLALSAILLISMSVLFLFEDFSSPALLVSNKKEIAINYPLYNTNFNASDITNISLIYTIPSGNKTNGIATNDYSRGYFNLDSYGNCRLYIYNNKPPYILIRLKDSYVIYNDKEKEATINMYKKLKNLSH